MRRELIGEVVLNFMRNATWISISLLTGGDERTKRYCAICMSSEIITYHTFLESRNFCFTSRNCLISKKSQFLQFREVQKSRFFLKELEFLPNALISRNYSNCNFSLVWSGLKSSLRTLKLSISTITRPRHSSYTILLESFIPNRQLVRSQSIHFKCLIYNAKNKQKLFEHTHTHAKWTLVRSRTMGKNIDSIALVNLKSKTSRFLAFRI